MTDLGTMQRAAAVMTVDLVALVDNWQALAGRVAPAVCGAVVKADAYGLGATPVVRALLRAGCREFFVAQVDEGVCLREALGSAWPPDARLHVLHGARPGAEHDCLAHGLVPVLQGLDQVARWQALARRQGHALPAALLVDTGMTRQGLSPAQLRQLADSPPSLCGIAVTLLMSDLLNAADPQDPLNRCQLALFRDCRCRFPAALGCLAHSAGIFVGREFHLELVRPGAALYGVAPLRGQPNPMRRVVGLQGRLLQWREVAAERDVAGAHPLRARRMSRLATVMVGPADGYLHGASRRGHLRFQGVAVPLVGRATSEAVTVDVTGIDLDQLRPGALFDVLDAVHDVSALAQAARTSAYEILTSLGARCLRQYRGEAAW